MSLKSFHTAVFLCVVSGLLLAPLAASAFTPARIYTVKELVQEADHIILVRYNEGVPQKRGRRIVTLHKFSVLRVVKGEQLADFQYFQAGGVLNGIDERIEGMPQNFQGDAASTFQVLGFKDFAHTALTQHSVDAIGSELGSNLRLLKEGGILWRQQHRLGCALLRLATQSDLEQALRAQGFFGRAGQFCATLRTMTSFWHY